MSEGDEDRLSQIPLFAGLSPDELRLLAQAARHVVLEAGDMLFEQGDAGSTLYMIAEGRLRLFIRQDGNEELAVDVLGPGEVVGELSLFDPEPHKVSAQAEIETEVLALDRKAFLKFLRQYPEASVHMMKYLSERLRDTAPSARVHVGEGTPARLAHVLLFLADHDGDIQPGLVTSTLRKKDLADAIGTSEEWVAQMLEAWSQEGIIGMTGPRRLILHDVEALKALANRDD